MTAGDHGLAVAARRDDVRINETDAEIERCAVTLLVQQALVAVD